MQGSWSYGLASDIEKPTTTRDRYAGGDANEFDLQWHPRRLEGALLYGRRAELPEESRVDADGILEQLREIEGILTIWMGSEAHPMMWGPPGLTEKMSSLSGAVGGADARPTASMYAVFEDLSERFEVQWNRLNQIIEEEVGPLLSR